MIFRGAPERRIGGKRILRFGYAHRQMPVPGFLQLPDIVSDPGVCDYLIGPVDLGGDRRNFFPKGFRILVHKPQIRTFSLDCLDHGLGKINRTLAAVRPMVGQHDPGPQPFHSCADRLDFGGRITAETVDGDDTGQAKTEPHIFNVAFQVCQTKIKGRDVFIFQCGPLDAAVIFQGPHRRHDNGRIRNQSGLSALDIDKFLGPQVGPKSGFGDHVIGKFQGAFSGDHRIAAMGDIGERTAVYHRRVVFQGLHQIGLQGFLQQHRHGTVRLQVHGPDRPALAILGNYYVTQSCFHVGQRSRQAKYRHHFRCHDDIEAVAAGNAMGDAAQADHRIA